MTPEKKDYFAYLPRTPERARWGVEVLGVGRASIPARVAYPPKGHPADHVFDVNKGRTLHALQILCLTAGEGIFESVSAGCHKIAAGAVLILFPDEWHTYRPVFETGWTEHWIELDGMVPRELIRGGVLQRQRCVLRGAAESGIEAAFDELHSLLDGRRQAGVPELSSVAYRLLALSAELPGIDAQRSMTVDKVRRAERVLSATGGAPPDLPALARELGWGYSYFRRVFKEQTGLPPWQYHLQSRLAQARRWIASADLTLDEVAERTGFASAYHLSNAFKKAFGESPAAWRNNARRRV